MRYTPTSAPAPTWVNGEPWSRTSRECATLRGVSYTERRRRLANPLAAFTYQLRGGRSVYADGWTYHPNVPAAWGAFGQHLNQTVGATL